MKRKVVLWAIATLLVTLQLRLTWLTEENSHQLIVSSFFWLAIISLLWKKRDSLNLESGIYSRFFGLFLVTWGFINSIYFHTSMYVPSEIYTFISALGLCLFASGLKGLKQYYQELVIIFILSIPKNSFLSFMDKYLEINTLVAKFSTFVLWYIGFQVNRQGANVFLPKGAIEVTPACSGLSLMWLLLQLAVLFILMFPIKHYQKFLIPVIAVCIALLVMGIRSSMLALFINASDSAAFAYWHGYNGAHIFSIVAFLLFGAFCQFLLESQDKPENQSRYQDYLEL